MADWCMNTTYVSGPPDVVARFLAAVRAPDGRMAICAQLAPGSIAAGDTGERPPIDYDTTVETDGDDGVVLRYGTPSGPLAEATWVAISEQFPALTFETRYEGRVPPAAGGLLAVGGDVLAHHRVGSSPGREDSADMEADLDEALAAALARHHRLRLGDSRRSSDWREHAAQPGNMENDDTTPGGATFTVTFVGDYAALVTTVTIEPTGGGETDEVAAIAAAWAVVEENHGIDIAESRLDTVEVVVEPAG